ncbi:MAG: hypothetical protein HQL93_00350 [Magnetococcales bacterium]|nr:hypothetical protein [Magnetococcales bacterium]
MSENIFRSLTHHHATQAAIGRDLFIDIRQKLEDAFRVDMSCIQEKRSMSVAQTPLQKLVGEIASYQDMSKGWDGYNGEPIRHDVVSDVLNFLDVFPFKQEKKELDLPIPAPSGDGEMGLYWRKGQAFAEVSFFGDGKISFYAVNDGIDLESFDDCEIPKSCNHVIDIISNIISNYFT